MSDVTLAREQILRTGLDGPAFTTLDAVDVYFAPNDGRMLLYFKNTGGSPSTVTFDLSRLVAGAELSDQTVSVPATSGEVPVGPFPAEWNDDLGPNPGHLKFTQDQATGVTVAVLRL